MAHLLPQPNAQAVNSLGCTTTSFSHREIAHHTRSSSFQRKPLHRVLVYTVKNIKHEEKQAQNQLLRVRGPSPSPTVGSAAGGLPFSIQCHCPRKSSQLRVYTCTNILRARARAGTTSTGKSMLLENPQKSRRAAVSVARRQR